MDIFFCLIFKKNKINNNDFFVSELCSIWRANQEGSNGHEKSLRGKEKAQRPKEWINIIKGENRLNEFQIWNCTIFFLTIREKKVEEDLVC